MCRVLRDIKRFIGEKVVRPMRVRLYFLEWNLTK